MVLYCDKARPLALPQRGQHRWGARTPMRHHWGETLRYFYEPLGGTENTDLFAGERRGCEQSNGLDKPGVLFMCGFNLFWPYALCSEHDATSVVHTRQ